MPKVFRAADGRGIWAEVARLLQAMQWVLAKETCPTLFFSRVCAFSCRAMFQQSCT